MGKCVTLILEGEILKILMSHFRGAGIGAFCDERNPQDLVAVIADDFQGILVGILDLFFFFPK